MKSPFLLVKHPNFGAQHFAPRFRLQRPGAIGLPRWTPVTRFNLSIKVRCKPTIIRLFLAAQRAKRHRIATRGRKSKGGDREKGQSKQKSTLKQGGGACGATALFSFFQG
jgi:hypothetical protein